MTAPIDPADDLGQQEVHTDPPSNEGAPSVGADGPPMFGKGPGTRSGGGCTASCSAHPRRCARGSAQALARIRDGQHERAHARGLALGP